MISLIITTKGRPRLFCRLIDSIKETTGGDWEIVAGVDDDDESLSDYPILKEVRYVKVPHMNTTALLNKIIPMARGNVCALIADDCVIATDLWDLYVERFVIGKKYFLIKTSDGMFVNSFHAIISRSLSDVFDGKIYLEEMRHYYLDPWIEEIANGAGVCYDMPNIVFRHIQDIKDTPLFKANMAKANLDRSLYERTEHIRKEMSAKLRKAIDENK